MTLSKMDDQRAVVETDQFRTGCESFITETHAALIENAAAAYGKKVQRIRPPGRSESSWEVSEFHLSDKVKPAKENNIEKLSNTLAGSLDKVGKHSHVAQKLKKVQSSSKPLPAPLERPETEKIKRAIAYDRTKTLLNRWEPVVTTNKVTPELHFPLNTPYFKMGSTKDFISNYKPQSKLEKEVDLILSGISIETHDKEKPEPKKTFFLNRKEILEQRRELARIRAQQSYREAKARRQNKIKSKKYHRILRREKTKKLIQEFEKLQKTDPEAALKKLEELEKTRAEERVSLRHRSTGQWARNKAVLAKYDKESRQQLHQQLRMSRDLTMKVNAEESSEGEDIIDDCPLAEYNPWVKGNNDYEEFTNEYRKYWEEQNAKNSKTKGDNEASGQWEEMRKLEPNNIVRDSKNIHDSKIIEEPEKSYVRFGFKVTESNEFKSMKNKRSFNADWKCFSTKDSTKCKKVKPNGVRDVDDIFEQMENIFKKKFERKASQLKGEQTIRQPKVKNIPTKKNSEAVKESESQIKEDCSQKAINDETHRSEWSNAEFSNFDLKLNSIAKNVAVNPKEKFNSLEINPANFIQIEEKKLKTTQIPEIEADEEDDTPKSEREKLMTITEAFTDDDVVAEFRQEKEEIADKEQPKDIDLNLPGWGEWAGKGIPESKQRKKRFVIKAPKYLPRKDDKRDSVIINENSDAKARVHQVRELPYPYIAIEAFENSIRAPLGSTWVPETAHRNLVAPKIKTLMGTVIEPLSEDALVDNSENIDDLNEL